MGMDVETTAAIVGLSDRIDTLAVSLRAEMAQMRNEWRAEFREGLAENRTHAQMLFESLRDDIRLVAEDVATISAKLDSGRR